MSPLLRRGSAEPAGDTLLEQEPEPQPEAAPVSKGRATPSQREARAARAAQVKGQPKNRKEAAARRRELTEQNRYAMKSTDISKLPAAARASELILTRNLVDSRLNLGSAMLPFIVFYFVGAILVSSVAKNLSTPFFLLTLVCLITVGADSFILASKAEKIVQGKHPGSTVKIRSYAFRRAISMRRFRRPPALVTRADQARFWRT